MRHYTRPGLFGTPTPIGGPITPEEQNDLRDEALAFDPVEYRSSAERRMTWAACVLGVGVMLAFFAVWVVSCAMERGHERSREIRREPEWRAP